MKLDMQGWWAADDVRTSLDNGGSRPWAIRGGRFCLLRAMWFVIAMAAWGHGAQALTFAYPKDGDVIGDIRTVAIGAEDTLPDLARKYNVGYNEIVAANPDVDPWLPEPGIRVVIPTRYVLPSVPREGVVINLAEMRLYFFPPAGERGRREVLTYPIGIGQEGWSTPLGLTRIVAKTTDPSWTVPASIRAEYAATGQPLPKVVPPGPDNPLGKHAMRLSLTSYLIHGTNKPYGVGRRVSHGCIRMYPEDIEELFARVAIDTPVRIIEHPYKIGRLGGGLFLEAHEPLADPGGLPRSNLSKVVAAIGAIVEPAQRVQAQNRAVDIASRHTGVPSHVTEFQVERTLSREGWLLQLGAFTDMGNATRLASAVRALELPVSIQARANDGYCHVVVGPFAKKGSAEEAMGKVSANLSGVKGQLLSADRPGLLTECVY